MRGDPPSEEPPDDVAPGVVRPVIPYAYDAENGRFQRYRENRHLITFGPTRSGKGATVIVPALLQAGHSIICIDPKGQNAAITARQRRNFGEVFVLNPFGLHSEKPWSLPKHRFNPLAHLDIESENVVADVASLAEALIITEGKEPYFDNTARDLVKVLILHLVATNRGRATLPEVRRLITLPERDFVELLLEVSQSAYSFVAQPARRFLRATRDIESSISSAVTQTGFLDDPVLADPTSGTLTGSDFNLLELKERPTTVFLILPGRYMESYARFFRLIITAAIDQLTAEPGGYPTLMILDEFAALQNLAAISKAFGFAAGFNVQLWPFLQDKPQLQAIYGDKWETFLANAGLIQFFTPVDVTTAEYLQKRGGMRTGESQSKSKTYSAALWPQSRSVSATEMRVPLLPPEETMSLPRDRQIVFFAGVHSPSYFGRANYWENPRLQGLYDPDPYHI